MSKAILVLDKMPENCFDNCPCTKPYGDGCDAMKKYWEYNNDDPARKRPEWCPLKLLPEKKGKFVYIDESNIEHRDMYSEGCSDGWNACLGTILGEIE